MANLLWAEFNRYNRFKEFLEEVNDDARSGHPSTSTTNKNIEAAEKVIWIIVESILENLLMMLAIVWLMLNNFYGCFRHFAHCFLPLQWMNLFMNSSHQVVRSIRDAYAPIVRSSSKTYRIVKKPIMDFSAWLTNKTVIIPQSSYSPHFNLAELFFFLKLNTAMKGKCFATIDEIEEKSEQKLLAIPKCAFQKCFED